MWGSSVQRVLTVIPGRKTQAARQFNYAPLCPLIPPREGEGGAAGEEAIRGPGISTCCSTAENFTVRNGEGLLLLRWEAL